MGSNGENREDDELLLSSDERWEIIDKISDRVVSRGKREHKLREVISDLTVDPKYGLPFAIAVLFGFWSFFGSFAGLFTDGFAVPAFDGHFLPWLQSVFPDPGGPLYWIFVGDPAAGNSFAAFGVLTTGLFVALGVVLPAIVAFYLILTLLEDSGYLPRLAVMADTVLHKIGLHGFAIVPTILSLGCNVPGVMASRTLETRKQRFMMMTLLSVFIPCGAQIGVMKALIPQYAGLILLFLFAGFFLMGVILNFVVPGESPEILVDVPTYRKPLLKNVGSKLWARLKSFFKVAIPFVLTGVLAIQILYWFGVIEWLGTASEPILTGWFGVPAEASGPLVAGFMRKGLAVALLGGIEMTTGQLITSVVVISLYFPCLATFIMIIKEGGFKTMLKSLVVLAGSVFIFGGLMRLIVSLVGI
ncbi:MAG: nucleoside recognition domain-containing protein [Candidatus Hadarchaeia archaeon]